MDCSQPCSSVRGSLQARILEWALISPFRGSSWPRNWTHISCIAGGFFTVWTTMEALEILPRYNNSGYMALCICTNSWNVQNQEWTISYEWLLCVTVGSSVVRDKPFGEECWQWGVLCICEDREYMGNIYTYLWILLWILNSQTALKTWNLNKTFFFIYFY